MLHTGIEEATIERMTPRSRRPATTTAEPNTMRKSESARIPLPNPNRLPFVTDIR
jgi:hypothetical protein